MFRFEHRASFIPTTHVRTDSGKFLYLLISGMRCNITIKVRIRGIKIECYLWLNKLNSSLLYITDIQL